MPSISVIISTYNKPKFLEKVLMGYAFQTFKDFEIIIADDGSKDETRKIVEEFHQFFPHLHREPVSTMVCYLSTPMTIKDSKETTRSVQSTFVNNTVCYI